MKTANIGGSTRYLEFDSALGPMRLVANDQGVSGIYFIGQRHEPRIGADWRRADDDPLLQQTRAQLVEYFAGRRQRFDLPIAALGTAFQQRVWQAISAIEFGQTLTYSDLARHAGNPKAIRAAGAATGRNPISIVVPCHRVLGAGHSLTGYAGGIDRKRWVLNLEGVRT
jgi:methylated-DNA-[protein]-cysteine S-methyltransferase